jgi:hypothetical protein
MNASRIILIVFVMIGLVISSIWLGVGVASDSMGTILKFAGVAGLLICILLGQRIWLLFLFLISMEVPIAKGFMSTDFGCMIFIGFSVLIFLMRRLKLHYSWMELDWWRLLVALTIFQAYVRNPVGLNAFGASSVGARPYFVAVIALVAGYILSKYRIQPKELKWCHLVAITGSLFELPINTWRYGLGSSGPASNVGTVAGGVVAEGAGRSGSHSSLAQNLVAILAARISPLKASFHPVWVWGVLLVFGAAMLSGYRNAIAYVGIVMLVGIAYRGGLVSLIISFTIGAFALTGLSMINLAFPLPAKAQRALSPFPGTWDRQYVQAAELSTDWRLEMWEAALFTDHFIKNKIIGDGLGMTREELERLEDLNTKGAAEGPLGLTKQQEALMLVGGYHSGPVQTIRTTGYVGLLFLLIAMIRLMVHAHRQIKRAWGTEWQFMTMFFCLPIVSYPLFWAFIFGEFKGGIFYLFVYSGLVDVLRNNLPLPAYVKKRRHTYQPLVMREGRPRHSTRPLSQT